MDSTEEEQSSSETAETETGGLTKPGIDLSTEIDGENHGLNVTNLCLSIPVVLLAFADSHQFSQVSCAYTTFLAHWS